MPVSPTALKTVEEAATPAELAMVQDFIAKLDAELIHKNIDNNGYAIVVLVDEPERPSSRTLNLLEKAYIAEGWESVKLSPLYSSNSRLMQFWFKAPFWF